MSLLDKLNRLFRLDSDTSTWDLKTYIYYRLADYESEKPIFESFDDYIDYCLEKMEDLK